MSNPVHHIELWTSDLDGSAAGFDWLLTAVGWAAVAQPDWPQGRIWEHPSGVYILLEQSPDLSGPHRRTNAGLNHLALRLSEPARLDALRSTCHDHGWHELFGEHYPHAGGPGHTALFIENDEGFEVEVVAG